MSNLASCQNKSPKKTSCNQDGFCIQDSSLFYNKHIITIGQSVNEFANAAGKPDRIVTDSSGGNTIKSWKWNKSGFNAYLNEKNKIEVYNMNINDSNIEKEYSSIEEVVKILGKFDQFKEEKVPTDVRKYYIWDHLGIEIYVTEKDEINSIFLNTLHPNKTKEITKQELENTDLIYNNTPKEEYKGLFTYNGHTIDFGKIGYDNWFKTVKDLKIEGESYDPPGDSKQWSRIIRERNLTIEMIRESNELGATKGFKVSEIGVINMVKSIQISN